MRISKKWLNEYIPVNDLSDSEIDGLLSLSGTEIEETLYPWEGLKGVILGTVIETRPHPSHSRLIVCIIQLPGETKRLVTADKTVKTGDRVLVALPGTVLYNGKRIEAHDFGGVLSEGMLCSLEELGLENKSDYVYRLTDEWPEGFLEDTVFEASITSNRPDELGMLGIARLFRKRTVELLARNPQFLQQQFADGLVGSGLLALEQDALKIALGDIAGFHEQFAEPLLRVARRDGRHGPHGNAQGFHAAPQRRQHPRRRQRLPRAQRFLHVYQVPFQHVDHIEAGIDGRLRNQARFERLARPAFLLLDVVVQIAELETVRRPTDIPQGAHHRAELLHITGVCFQRDEVQFNQVQLFQPVAR